MNKLFDVVIGMTKRSRGIGFNNGLPWPHLKKDMKRFRDITGKTEDPTKRNAIIMGRKTWDSLPKKPLPNRENIVISATQWRQREICTPKKDHVLVGNLDQALNSCGKDIESIYVIGGQQVCETALQHESCNKLHITEIDGEYECDTFFPKIPNHFKLFDSKKVVDKVDLEFKTYQNVLDKYSEENQYLDLVNDIMDKGEYKIGRNGGVYSLFGKQHCFDLEKGFPLLTTKRMFYGGIIKELLFFLRGGTDATELSNNGVKIWDPNTTREFLDSRELNHYQVGDMGPMYGFQWRHFGAIYQGKNFDYTGIGYDQLWNLIDELVKNPNSRRLLLTTYDPSKVAESVLAPCHGLTIQFNVRDEKILDCKMYQRSVDTVLGYPFNISSYALLNHIICYVTGYTPGKLYMTLGDTHIYESHTDKVKKQLDRVPYKFPSIKIKKSFDYNNSSTDEKIKFIEQLGSEDIEVNNYHYYSGLKFDMVA